MVSGDIDYTRTRITRQHHPSIRELGVSVCARTRVCGRTVRSSPHWMGRFVSQQSNIPNGLASALLCPGECEDRASNAWQLRLRHHSAAASEENNRLMMMTTAAARNGRTADKTG